MPNDANDYGRAFAAKPQPLTLEQAAKVTPPMQLVDTEGMIDIPRMRAYRLNRIREQLKAREIGAVVLFDPLSIRYAAGVRNCALFQMHIKSGYLFVPMEGPTVYFDSEPGRFTGEKLETIDEIRDDLMALSYMFGGSNTEGWAGKWAAQMMDLVEKHCGGNKRLAVEKPELASIRALESLGLEVLDPSELMAHARKIKSPEEILCMNQTIAVAEDGMTRMRDNLRAGMTEIQLWSYMWQATIEGGGEWIDYRLLASGERTNPWQQEASSRMIRPGDLVCFDCGMVGPFSYGADISRAFHCGPGRPSDYQKQIYTYALEEIRHNTELMQPGASFREIVEKRHIQPAGFGDKPYPALAHGLGMADEYPVIFYPQDGQYSYDGQLEAGMVICVESYVGEPDGDQGVKLENQLLITETGPVTLSTFPFEEDLILEQAR